MKNSLLLFLFLFSLPHVRDCSAQNLVPNPSFEDTIICPLIGFGGGDCVFFNEGLGQTCSDWHSVGCGSPDYWHTCTGFVPGPNSQGFQFPRTGSAFIGVFSGGGLGCHVREYATSQLTQPLTSLTTYYVELYVSLANANCFPLPSDGLGALFTVGEPDTTGTSNASGTHQTCNPLNYTPQVRNPVGSYITDTVNWVRISGTFTASGGEDHITLGNFADTISFQCGYYWIDDVLVVPDSIEHVNIKENIFNDGVTLFPNPTSDILNLSFQNFRDAEIIIYDRLGIPVFSTTARNHPEYSGLTLNLASFSPGVYLLKLVSEKDGRAVIKKLIKL